jgi:hypothetical protein
MWTSARRFFPAGLFLMVSKASRCGLRHRSRDDGSQLRLIADICGWRTGFSPCSLDAFFDTTRRRS